MGSKWLSKGLWVALATAAGMAAGWVLSPDQVGQVEHGANYVSEGLAIAAAAVVAFLGGLRSRPAGN